MKIAFVSEFIYPFHKGGAEKRFYEIARRLAYRGHEVHWFGMKHWAGPGSMQYEQIHLHGVCEPLDPYTRTGRRSIATSLQLGERLAMRVTRAGLRFDVIDCSLYPFFNILALGILLPSTPMAVTWHEFWGDHWYSYLGTLGCCGKLIERLTAVVPQTIIAVSEMARDGLCEVGVSPWDIAIVRNGISYAEISNVPPADKKSDLIYFGRLKNHKNIDVIIRSVAILKRTRPDFKCLIIGDGPERQSLEALAQQLGVAQNVHFTGIVEDSAALLGLAKASKVFVNASTKEGGGSITLLEANACGLPVLAVRHKLGIDASLITPGQNGYWADALDPGLFAAAIDGLLADDARRNAMRQQCMEFASRFDWQNVALECEDVYAGLARKTRLPSRARQALRRLFSSPRARTI
jgi:glycosyltransferase involved in cell wall biosynthesis